MVILRCTKQLLRRLDKSPTQHAFKSTNALGDWYAKLLQTSAGDLVIFANERTLLSVAIPVSHITQLESLFALRVYNPLRLLDIPEEYAELEIAAYDDLTFAPTASRRILGSLNEIGYQYQWIVERNVGESSINLSDAELELSRFLHSPLGYKYPVEVAKELLCEVG